MNKFNVATFNIWKNDGDFPNRIYDLSNEIKQKNFDVICLQEDFNSKDFSSSKFLNIELDYNYITTKTRKKHRQGYLSSSNLTILSKYDVILLKEIYFNKNKENERACQIIEVKLKECNILIINTHLSHNSSKNRMNQINEILEYLKKYDSYDITMICGDLNAFPNSNEIKVIREKGFTDKNFQYSHENGVTIDYILYKSNLDINVDSKVDLKDYSDHYCLVNTFKF